ncbi:hypothetical protein [Nocardia brasiliensis]|uniref:hypothetical protein n=1 Tax=Nocardia brasiliensis TaxID=37326 RepID=UPI00366D83C8
MQLYGLNAIAGKLAPHDPAAIVELILHPSGRGTGLSGRALFTALRELPRRPTGRRGRGVFRISAAAVPRHPRLSTLVGNLGGATGRTEQARATAVAVAERLGSEPEWRRSAIDLLLARNRWADAVSSARSIRQACGLAEGALVRYPAERLGIQLARTIRMVHGDTVSAIAYDRAADVDTATALAAVALIAQGGGHFGWTSTLGGSARPNADA